MRVHLTCVRTTGRLAKNGSARSTEDNSGSMAEDSGDVETSRALDIHEERVRGLNQSLELMLLGFVNSRRVQQVMIDRL